MANALIDRFGWLPALGWTALTAMAAMSAGFAWSGVFGDITVDVKTPTRVPVSMTPQLRPLLSGTPRQHADALLAKPLFLPGRTPPAAPTPASAPVQVVAVGEDATPPTYSLGGVAITPVRRMALLRPQDGQDGNWVSEGEVTGQGWTLISVRPNRVLLARGRHQAGVELYRPEYSGSAHFEARLDTMNAKRIVSSGLSNGIDISRAQFRSTAQ